MTKEEVLREWKKYKKIRKEKKHPFFTLKEAQETVRTPQAWKCPKGVVHCRINLPSCFINKKVRVIVVKEKK